MRKLIMGLLVVGVMGLFSVRAFASASYDSGMVKMRAGNYTGARADFQIALQEATGGGEQSDAQYFIGYCYEMEGNYPTARTEFTKVLAIAGGHPFYRAEAQLSIAACYEFEKDYPTAIVEWNKLLVMAVADGDSYHRSLALFDIGFCEEAEGDTVKAQEAYLLVCNKGGSIAVFKQALDKIDPTIVGVPKYLAYLNKLLLVVPAKAENAEFLGFVKSEIEKLKLK